MNNRRDHPSGQPRSMKNALLLTAISTILILLLLFFFFRPELQSFSKQEVTPSEHSTEKEIGLEAEAPDFNKLTGRWMRTDGDYVIEVTSVSTDGMMEAGYFNPQPIHIARSEWVVDNGKLYMMVELQDVNYPGSTYGLQYHMEKDKLSGSYFQAVDKDTYEVEFVREK